MADLTQPVARSLLQPLAMRGMADGYHLIRPATGHAFVTTNSGAHYVTTNNGATRVQVKVS